MKKLLKALLFFVMIFGINTTLAGTIDYFKVEFNKKSIGMGEALDLTITAMDKNDEIVTNYTGNVFGFSETDDSVELPEDLSNDEGYSFKLSDLGVKKFENAVKFNTPGQQSISLYDANDYENVTGKGEINIVKSSENQNNVEIEILTPESNTTIPENSVKISGSTKKNHQIRITLNNKDTFSTTSNTAGIFEKEINGLETGTNSIKAFTLDADENIIGDSQEVIINIDNSKPQFKKIILSPISDDGKVEENTNVEAKVFASSGLKSVKLLFNDGVIELSETEDGIYTGIFKTPSEAKEFNIDVILNDNLGNKITEKEVAKIEVFLVENNSAEEKTNTSNVKEEGKKDEVKEELHDLKIKGLKLVKLKNKSILTWDKLEDAKNYDIFKKNDETGDFEFIKNVDEERFEVDIIGEEIKYQYFAVKAKTETNSGEIITGDLSEATKIQTGPNEIIIMLIISILLGFFFFLAKRKSY